MPPFKLELPDRRPSHSRQIKLLYIKNLYSEGVKVRDWEKGLEHKPIDVDPYCPGSKNYFLSHYNRIGSDNEGQFRTTTQDMLEQIYSKKYMQPDKIMANYYAFNDNAECLTEYKPSNCPKVCADEFLTTMQNDYGVPYPYKMQRLAFKKIPFMQNRRYKNQYPDYSSCKFYDEDFHFVSCELNKHKGIRNISYNSMTDQYE